MFAKYNIRSIMENGYLVFFFSRELTSEDCLLSPAASFPLTYDMNT